MRRGARRGATGAPISAWSCVDARRRRPRRSRGGLRAAVHGRARSRRASRLRAARSHSRVVLGAAALLEALDAPRGRGRRSASAVRRASTSASRRSRSSAASRRRRSARSIHAWAASRSAPLAPASTASRPRVRAAGGCSVACAQHRLAAQAHGELARRAPRGPGPRRCSRSARTRSSREPERGSQSRFESVARTRGVCSVAGRRRTDAPRGAAAGSAEVQRRCRAEQPAAPAALARGAGGPGAAARGPPVAARAAPAGCTQQRRRPRRPSCGSSTPWRRKPSIAPRGSIAASVTRVGAALVGADRDQVGLLAVGGHQLAHLVAGRARPRASTTSPTRRETDGEHVDRRVVAGVRELAREHDVAVEDRPHGVGDRLVHVVAVDEHGVEAR